MHRAFRRLLVLTLAVALVASAAAWRQCPALQLAAATAMQRGGHVQDHRAGAAHALHDHHAMHQHAADDSAAPAADDDGCMKCCTMCAVANALLPGADRVVIFASSSYVFARDHATRSGRTVAVDPGIPKSIA